ncbi:response regulator [Anaerolineales bacterium HSG6]|nr:response regulator [Anaerolineales bacterium HSG6]MDM8531131.1 response regulator [Anaerolineales bacterium HSG25]
MEEPKPVIMIVDDQPDLIDGIKLILEQEGYEVWTATNGQIALNRLEEAFLKPHTPDNVDKPSKILPDLILADIMMPVMDGYELYQRVRANPYLNHIPFTFLTAKVDAGEIREGKKLGVDDYLTKPCLPDDLLASVEGKLNRTQQRRSLQAQFTDDIGKTPAAGIIFLIALIAVIILVIGVTVMLTLAIAG